MNELAQRFWSKVDFGDGSGCWMWVASKDWCGPDQYKLYRFGKDVESCSGYRRLKRWPLRGLLSGVQSTSRMKLCPLCHRPIMRRRDTVGWISKLERVHRRCAEIEWRKQGERRAARDKAEEERREALRC